jgi:hypothetical protein
MKQGKLVVGDKNVCQKDGRRLLDPAMARMCAPECSLAACSSLVSKGGDSALGFCSEWCG